jgi:hypothetical protein
MECADRENSERRKHTESSVLGANIQKKPQRTECKSPPK